MEERGEGLSVVEERDLASGHVLCRFERGRLLGKVVGGTQGGFAKCYEFTEVDSRRRWAVKVVDKSSLGRAKAREKVGRARQLASEIRIHRAVRSPFVVRFDRHFEDADHVYLVLELCPNQTLNELVRRRRRLTEVEARYYLRQIALAVKDLHQQLIIHRDLKLGNVLLTGDLQIRVSDFGLAARLAGPSERRKTMCGTPNYIAPEILASPAGHSFEVDLWSVGVIAYALLVGRPPFETSDVKSTYAKIKACSYSFPDGLPVSAAAKQFIAKLLQRNPDQRATIDEVLADEFLSTALPASLPLATLACPPATNFVNQFLNYSEKAQDSTRALVRTSSNDHLSRRPLVVRAASTANLMRGKALSKEKVHDWARDARENLLESARHERPKVDDPGIWVVCFEENPKFGVAYLLNTNAVGMRFNDCTCAITDAAYASARYLEPKAQESFSLAAAPERLAKKLKILGHYHRELRKKKDLEDFSTPSEQLILRERQRHRETPEEACSVYVTAHCKTSKANLFWLSNRNLQVVFRDSTQLLMGKEAVVFVGKAAERRRFSRAEVDAQGEDVRKRFKYTLSIVESLKDQNKENRVEAQEALPSSRPQSALSRCSSTLKFERRPQLRGCASMTRLPSTAKIIKC